MVRDSDKPRLIKSDETLFDIIKLLQERDGAGVTELANEMGMAKSSIHIHLKSLEEHGFAVKRDDKYHIGLRFLDLGLWARDKMDIYHEAHPKVRNLAEETGEQAWCIVEENGLGVYIAGAVGKHSVKTDARIGDRRHLHILAAGKAILAHLPRDYVKEIIDRHGLPAKTEHTITDEDRLFDALDEIRNQRYALNLEETINGLNAVGVPILFDNQHVIGALAVSGAANRMDVDRCEGEISENLLAAANEIELNLSYPEFTMLS